MPKIFFCYRRDDSTYQAGRIFDHLAAHFGQEELFKDVDSMPIGRDFRQVLLEKVARCDVLLALIGDNWLTATEATGKRRIDNPLDFVRIEIESALRRDIPVVPVLVGRAPLPKPEELPQGLSELAYRHIVQIRPDPDFRHDVEQLIRGINKVLGEAAPAAPAPAGKAPRAGQVIALGEHARRYILDKVLKKPGGSVNVSAAPPGAAAAAPLEGTVRVGILKSGNATYVNEIEHALRASLETRLAAKRVRLIASSDCVEWEKEAEWGAAVSRLMTRGREGFRYLVGIGTQAAVALRDGLGADFGKVPTLLLGITYPRITGLVDSEDYRCETRQVTAVRYGCGLDAVASLLHHRIFPGRQLCYVYQTDVPQDELGRAELGTTRLAREGLLRFLPLRRRLQAEDLADKDAVYFSWYTFTRLFHEKEFEILLNRLTVSIMRDNVRDAAAAVGVGTDHDWIGNRGAELITEHFAARDGDKPDWGAREVVISPMVYWLHRGLAKRHGIEFSRAALDGASEVYD